MGRRLFNVLRVVNINNYCSWTEVKATLRKSWKPHSRLNLISIIKYDNFLRVQLKFSKRWIEEMSVNVFTTKMPEIKWYYRQQQSV